MSPTTCRKSAERWSRTCVVGSADERGRRSRATDPRDNDHIFHEDVGGWVRLRSSTWLDDSSDRTLCEVCYVHTYIVVLFYHTYVYPCITDCHVDGLSSTRRVRISSDKVQKNKCWHQLSSSLVATNRRSTTTDSGGGLHILRGRTRGSFGDNNDSRPFIVAAYPCHHHLLLVALGGYWWWRDVRPSFQYRRRRRLFQQAVVTPIVVVGAHVPLRTTTSHLQQ
jgi:hypothetical protein